MDYVKFYDKYKKCDQKKYIIFYPVVTKFLSGYERFNTRLKNTSVPPVGKNLFGLGHGMMLNQDKFLLGYEINFYSGTKSNTGFQEKGFFNYLFTGIKLIRWKNFSLYKIRGVGFGTSSLIMNKLAENTVSAQDQTKFGENSRKKTEENEKIMMYNIGVLKRGLLFFNSCLGVDYSSKQFYCGVKAGLNVIPGLIWSNQLTGNGAEIKSFRQLVFNGFVSLNVGIRISQ